MNAQDLGRLAGREVDRVRFCPPPPVTEDQVVAIGHDPFRPPLVEDAPPFHARSLEDAHPGMSNHTWTWPVPMAFSYADSFSPGARQAVPPMAPSIMR